jgi:hypothetical protein
VILQADEQIIADLKEKIRKLRDVIAKAGIQADLFA